LLTNNQYHRRQHINAWKEVPPIVQDFKVLVLMAIYLNIFAYDWSKITQIQLIGKYIVNKLSYTCMHALHLDFFSRNIIQLHGCVPFYI
jgi:hypothetical protein